MRKIIRRINGIISAVLAVCVLGSVSVSVSADKANADLGAVKYAVDENAYLTYLEKNNNFADAASDIVLDNAVALLANGAELKSTHTTENGTLLNNALIFKSESGVEYTVFVPSDGLYNLEFKYIPLSKKGNNITFSVKVDGDYPFREAETLTLPKRFVNAGEYYKDAQGNEYSPEQIGLTETTARKIYDFSGIVNNPYCFALTKGEHKITITAGSSEFLLAEAVLCVPDKLESYESVFNTYGQESSEGARSIVIEGEDALVKDTRAIVPKSDTGSSKIHPADAKIQKINYLGGPNWKSPGERVDWHINVEKSGLYDIRFIYKQDQTVNGYSYRVLTVDGKVPFNEANNIGFYYGTGWETKTFADKDGNPYYLYLTAGEHTISLTCTLGETEEFYQRLKAISEELGNLYIEIAMITSDAPDKNRDYDLFRQIPEFNERLEEYYKTLIDLAADMEALFDQNTSSIAAIRNMARILKNMIENPYTAQNYVSDYYGSYTTISSWLYDMKGMPLSIDRIILVAKDEAYDYDTPGFFENVLFGIERFLVSFTADYSNSSAENSDKSLKLWVNWGRDQAMVLNSLIQESFTPNTGISVNLELTDASLIKGMLSNNAPDISLHMARTEPVNLAMRDALYDLSSFDDYDDVIKRFGDSAVTPYKYGNGVYALPDTQSFYIMFYRKDIFESLKLSVPETWDEFLETTAVLQRNNMQAWIPYTQITASTTVNTGVGGLNLFASILQQFGGKLYNDDLSACNFEAPTSLEAFTYWTDMYTKYKLPETASFYNRFRIGTMPLGIEGYTQYTMLSEAAPEIAGRWGIALVPGIKQEDGSINHTVAGSGTGCVILNDSKNKAEAWEFLKWWTAADTQLKYNNNVESILGTVSRTTTSTLEAFEGMAWDAHDLDILLEQRSYIEEIPEVPGSYYVSRSVDQAFWNVMSGEAPKDILMKWTEIANNEIERKLNQYSKN